jgi:hypothetical protein
MNVPHASSAIGPFSERCAGERANDADGRKVGLRAQRMEAATALDHHGPSTRPVDDARFARLPRRETAPRGIDPAHGYARVDLIAHAPRNERRQRQRRDDREQRNHDERFEQREPAAHTRRMSIPFHQHSSISAKNATTLTMRNRAHN